jgi:hypothetical protein
LNRAAALRRSAHRKRLREEDVRLKVWGFAGVFCAILMRSCIVACNPRCIVFLRPPFCYAACNPASGEEDMRSCIITCNYGVP